MQEKQDKLSQHYGYTSPTIPVNHAINTNRH
jgi:hypothetical protein